MRKKLIIVSVILLLLSAFFLYSWWSSAIRQPLDFSHAQHVKQSIACSSCHMKPEMETPAPSVLCKSCHAGQTFPQKVIWTKVYRTAPDIIFTHPKHSTVDCSTCHEAMTSADNFVHETRWSMDFCMECHAKTGANNSCGACHLNR